jgi:hypothetical protein
MKFKSTKSGKNRWSVYIETAKAIGLKVNRLLKIYHAGKEIALHSLCKNVKGEHVTDRKHYPCHSIRPLKNLTFHGSPA